MGRSINQPDFGTELEVIAAFPASPSSPSAIYIGTAADPASVTVRLRGSVDTFTFTGITSGQFLPVIAAEITAVVGLLPADVLFVR
jgi:hypothetical protein